MGLLARVLAQGTRGDLDEERFGELVLDVLDRTIELDELVGPASFAVEVMACSQDVRTMNIVLGPE